MLVEVAVLWGGRGKGGEKKKLDYKWEVLCCDLPKRKRGRNSKYYGGSGEHEGWAELVVTK